MEDLRMCTNCNAQNVGKADARSANLESRLRDENLSPALQRWVGVLRDESASGTAQFDSSESFCRPRGTRFLWLAYPALKGGAIIFRPASGTGALPLERFGNY